MHTRSLLITLNEYNILTTYIHEYEYDYLVDDYINKHNLHEGCGFKPHIGCQLQNFYAMSIKTVNALDSI